MSSLSIFNTRLIQVHCITYCFFIHVFVYTLYVYSHVKDYPLLLTTIQLTLEYNSGTTKCVDYNLKHTVNRDDY